MFRGINHINIDAKGRIAIPTSYREMLIEHCGGEMVVTIDIQERCLRIYPLPGWEVIQAKLEALPNINAQNRSVQSLLMGYATDIQMDGSGRLQITQPLKEFASLGKKLVLLGQGNKLELWPEEVWVRRREEWLAQEKTELSDALAGLSL